MKKKLPMPRGNLLQKKLDARSEIEEEVNNMNMILKNMSKTFNKNNVLLRDAI